MLALFSQVAAAAPDAAGIEAAWLADADAIARHGAVPATLEAADFHVLARGDVVVHRADTPEGAWATGAVFLPVAIGDAWIAVQDQQHRPIGRTAEEEVLPTSTPGSKRVYLRLALPWPVSDRQWVADLTSNGALFAATDGRVWQRRWTLGDRALAPHPADDAVWMEENTGGWTLLPAGDGTLAVMVVRSAPGGSLPREITQSWATSSLAGMLRRLREVAPGTRAHYDAGHEPVLGPDGRPLS